MQIDIVEKRAKLYWSTVTSLTGISSLSESTVMMCLSGSGIVGINNFSGVIYRRWFPLTCLSSSAFLGLAILEEMNLDNRDGIENE
ncbi:MAG: hypothetical protein CME19_11135 [Gemmatimonadetes bacterium]|nr:hypothetical protein [Gemmatimonadota bacterium]